MKFSHVPGSVDYTSADYTIRRVSRGEWLLICNHTDATLSSHSTYGAAKAAALLGPVAPATPTEADATTAEPTLANMWADLCAALESGKHPTSSVTPCPAVVGEMAEHAHFIMAGADLYHPRPARVAAALFAVIAAAAKPADESALPLARRAYARAMSALPPARLRAVERAHARAAATTAANPSPSSPPPYLLVGEWLAAHPTQAPEHTIHHPDAGEVRVCWGDLSDGFGMRLVIGGTAQRLADMPDPGDLIALIQALAPLACEP